MLTDKSKEDCIKALDLKTVLSDFCEQSLVCELILALVSLWLLLNSFKKTSKEKRPIDFLILYSKIFWLFYHYFSRYFDYFIIILPFFGLTVVTAWTID